MVKCQRSYKLKIYPNKGKAEAMRYAHGAFLKWCGHWSGKLLFNGNKRISTKGMGKIADQAQHRIRGVISALKASSEATGNKMNVPGTENLGMYAKISPSKAGGFDYWVQTQDLWNRGKPVKAPAKSHKALNKALESGWKLSGHCEVKRAGGEWYALVFLSKEVEKARPNPDFTGVDAGYRHSVATSEGHLGFRSDKVIRKARDSQRERYRQRTKHGQAQAPKGNKRKTQLKQLLDKEAQVIVRRSLRLGRSLAVESPKTLANLKSGKLHGWARNHLGARLKALARENSIWLMEINPAYSSQTCGECSERDAKSRVRGLFKCVKCGHTDNADVNAAKVLCQRGRTAVEAAFTRAKNLR